MARNFSGTNPRISLGDIATARFEAATNWSALFFLRVTDPTAGAYGYISKYEGATTNRQIRIRNRTTGNLVAAFDNGALELDIGSAFSGGDWHLGALTCDTADNVALYCYDMDGTLVGSDTGTHPGDAALLTAAIALGTAINGSSDLDGDLAHVAYFDLELSTNQILQYLRNPRQFVAQNIPDVQFYLSLTGYASPEPDWSSNQNSGTLSGTVVSADNPPVQMSIPFDNSILGGTIIPPAGSTPNFIGAEGAGAYTIGGREGTLYFVDNLNNSGSGSLREALEATGPRIIIPRIAGTIELTSFIRIRSPFCTFAGQAAFREGGEGITLKDAGIRVQAHDITIRYLRIRGGPFQTNLPGYGGSIEYTSFDCLDVSSNDTASDRRIYNVIIDHCSFSWGIDSNVDLFHQQPETYDAVNMTVQWCILTEPLVVDGSFDGKNSIMARDILDVSCHHNLFTNAQRRNPVIASGAGVKAEYINNLFYNMNGTTTFVSDEGGYFNFISNTFEQGSLTTTSNFIVIGPVSPPSTSECQIYVLDNIGGERTDPGDDEWDCVSDDYGAGNPASTGYQTVTPHSIDGEPITTHTRVEARELILADVGASLFYDDIDTATIADVDASTGALVADTDLTDGIDPAGSWPDLSSFTPPTDTSGDGMPDAWKTSKGLNPALVQDADYDLSATYTNIEIYLMDIAGDFIPSGAPLFQKNNLGTSLFDGTLL